MTTVRCGLLNARGARTGYTHWLAPELAREVRTFSGLVSENAINHGTNIGLVLEHHLRIQTELTSLIQKHINTGENNAEFISEVKRLEQVHIVTKEENITLRCKEISGDYSKAGICLIHWKDIPTESRVFLRKKLTGKISNIDEFTIKQKQTA
jgi:hypothetical protein